MTKTFTKKKGKLLDRQNSKDKVVRNGVDNDIEHGSTKKIFQSHIQVENMFDVYYITWNDY